jgi:hypothetical protein
MKKRISTDNRCFKLGSNWWIDGSLTDHVNDASGLKSVIGYPRLETEDFVELRVRPSFPDP